MNLPWPFKLLSGSKLTMTSFTLYQYLILPWPFLQHIRFWTYSDHIYNISGTKLTMTIFTLYKDLILPWPFLHNIRIQQNLLFVSFIWRILTPNNMYVWNRELWWLGSQSSYWQLQKLLTPYALFALEQHLVTINIRVFIIVTFDLSWSYLTSPNLC